MEFEQDDIVRVNIPHVCPAEGLMHAIRPFANGLTGYVEMPEFPNGRNDHYVLVQLWEEKHWIPEIKQMVTRTVTPYRGYFKPSELELLRKAQQVENHRA